MEKALYQIPIEGSTVNNWYFQIVAGNLTMSFRGLLSDGITVTYNFCAINQDSMHCDYYKCKSRRYDYWGKLSSVSRPMAAKSPHEEQAFRFCF